MLLCRGLCTTRVQLTASLHSTSRGEQARILPSSIIPACRNPKFCNRNLQRHPISFFAISQIVSRRSRHQLPCAVPAGACISNWLAAEAIGSNPPAIDAPKRSNAITPCTLIPDKALSAYSRLLFQELAARCLPKSPFSSTNPSELEIQK